MEGAAAHPNARRFQVGGLMVTAKQNNTFKMLYFNCSNDIKFIQVLYPLFFLHVGSQCGIVCLEIFTTPREARTSISPSEI